MVQYYNGDEEYPIQARAGSEEGTLKFVGGVIVGGLLTFLLLYTLERGRAYERKHGR